MPWTATFITVAPIAGMLADRIGERPLMVSGLALQAAGVDLAGADRRSRHVLRADARAVHRRRRGRLDGDPGGAELGRRLGRRWRTVGKAAGVNSMMRELGGVFGIAIVVAVFAGAGGYASAQAFADGFGPAIVVSAALAVCGASRAPGAAAPHDLQTAGRRRAGARSRGADNDGGQLMRR